VKREAAKRLKELVHAKKVEIEEKLNELFLAVFLMGAGGKGLEERRRLENLLEERGIIAIVAEDDLPRDVAPSLVEEYVLSSSEVELAFVNVESWGSAAEFVQYHENPSVAPKLRVLVESKHHPLYGRERGYLTDLYLTHLAVYGHVYAYGKKPFPSSAEIVVKLAERYKQWRALKLRRN